MGAAYLQTLKNIGEQLHAGAFPRVFNDGIVAPSNPIVDLETLGAETTNATPGTRRPSARSWQRTAGWQGPAGGSRPSGTAEPSGSRHLRENYCGQLDGVLAAYPHTKFWLQDDGMWLAVESSVLAGLEKRATFLTGVPFNRGLPVRAWAFWTWSIGFQWIGPRHTNAVDGSICAYNPQEGTWRTGDCLIALLDLYTAWACCHLHVEKFGWWPGPQTAQFAYERLTELNDNEHCGCRRGAPLYRDCCKQSDLQIDRGAAAVEFIGGFLRFVPRKPPSNMISFLQDQHNPPRLQKGTRDVSLNVGSCLSAWRGPMPSKAAGRMIQSSATSMAAI